MSINSFKDGVTFLRGSVVTAAVLLAASWVYLFVDQDASIGHLFSQKTWDESTDFVEALLGLNPGRSTEPAFLRWDSWRNALGLAYDTLAMSVLAIGIASIGALASVIPAARRRDDVPSSPVGRVVRGFVVLLFRATYVFTRAVPELLWAMIVIFVLSPGIVAGAVALAIHNYGIVGRLCAEVVEDLDPRPARALRSSGASGPQVLLYSVLPQALPQFLTYVLYRWEVIIRTTIVVGFVAAGGLGREFQLSMSFFHYTDVTLLLIVYFLLVVMVDLASAGLRRLAQ